MMKDAEGLDTFEDKLDEFVDRTFVASIGFTCKAIGNHHATCHGTVSHETCETCEGTTFHLEVGNLPTFVAEALDALVLVG